MDPTAPPPHPPSPQWQQQGIVVGSEEALSYYAATPPPPPHATAAAQSRKAVLSAAPPEAVIKCPRCQSSNTKFCYYNNYSLTQPRYFCKTCRRYWTRGGALRDVPIGGGSRKSAASKHSSSSADRSLLPAASKKQLVTTTADVAGQDQNLAYNPPPRAAYKFSEVVYQFLNPNYYSMVPLLPNHNNGDGGRGDELGMMKPPPPALCYPPFHGGGFEIRDEDDDHEESDVGCNEERVLFPIHDYVKPAVTINGATVAPAGTSTTTAAEFWNGVFGGGGGGGSTW